MKNFQVKHGQCDSIIFSQKDFLLKALSNCQTCTLLTAGFFSFDMSWNLSTNLSQNSMSCSTYLQLCQKKRRDRIISNLTNEKGETFSSLMTTKLLLEVISQYGFQDKGLPLPFNLANKRIYQDNQLTTELNNLF